MILKAWETELLDFISHIIYIVQEPLIGYLSLTHKISFFAESHTFDGI